MTKTEVLTVLIWCATPVLSFLLFRLLYQELAENSVLTDLKNRYRVKKGQRLLEEAKFYARYGRVENQSLIYRLDRMLLVSGIRGRNPWLTTGRFLTLCGVAASGAFGISIFVTGNMFTALFTMALGVTVIHVYLLVCYGIRYNSLEDGTITFVSILMNYAKESSDIITVMEDTGRMLEGPYRDLIETFLYTAAATGNTDLAFDYMTEAVDNLQLQTILINLKNCMHYQANYDEVLRQMLTQITAQLSAREERKNIFYSMKLTLAVISAASAVIAALIGNGLGIHMLAILTETKTGQFLLFVTGLMYLAVLVKLFGTDRE